MISVRLLNCIIHLETSSNFSNIWGSALASLCLTLYVSWDMVWSVKIASFRTVIQYDLTGFFEWRLFWESLVLLGTCTGGKKFILLNGVKKLLSLTSDFDAILANYRMWLRLILHLTFQSCLVMTNFGRNSDSKWSSA